MLTETGIDPVWFQLIVYYFPHVLDYSHVIEYQFTADPCYPGVKQTNLTCDGGL